MKLLSKKEASGMLNISQRTLDRRIAFGQIATVKNGRLVQITLTEIAAFIQRNSRGGRTA